MYKKIVYIIMLVFCTHYIFSVDTNSCKEIYRNNRIVVYAEDTQNYSDFINYINSLIQNMEELFNRKITKNISFYIYSDHHSSSLKIFGSQNDVIQTAMTDPVNYKIYLTSPYDTYKTKEYYYTVALHEIIHLEYSPADMWLREGLAVYLSGQLQNDINEVIINKYSDLYPNKMNNSNFFTYYQNFGWIVKYIVEEKLDNSISSFISFCQSLKKETILKYNSMDAFINDWNDWIKKRS